MLPPPLNRLSSTLKTAAVLVTESHREESLSLVKPTLTIRTLQEVEREAIEEAIALCDGNIPKAAALLDISASTIYRKRQFWADQE
jgi:two-component system repressor protein LuxO